MKTACRPPFRCSRARQHASLPLLQQRGRDQLPAHALGTVRSPEADHGAASGRRTGRHRQPGPHCPGNTQNTNKRLRKSDVFRSSVYRFSD